MTEIKIGYKHTEVGLIPSDWDLKEFVEVMDGFSSGQTPYRAIPEFYKGDIPWITSGELNYNVITDTIEKITIEGTREANLKMIPKGTFLFAITGLEAAGTRGSCAITGIEATTNQSCMALYPKKGLLITPYLYHYYVRYGNELAFKYCQGTKQQSYTGGIAKKLPIIVPPTIAEQIAIATALSDADALISSLEKLIAKKRNIKQGAMQKLLQPKEGWEVKKLGEIAEIYQPQTISQDVFIDDGYLVYGANGVVGKYHLFNHNTWQTTITCRGSTCGTVNRTVGKSWITGNAMVMNVDNNRKIDKLFFYYILTKQDFNQCITGSGQPQIVRTPLFDFNITIPRTIDEQEEIATILSDMDDEINALEIKLEKYRNIKLGMMQNLLTGKIRLV